MTAEAASSITIRRCETDDAEKALSLVALAWLGVELELRKVLLRLHRAIREGESVVVLAAENNGELCGAVVGQMLPGRVALVTPPQINEINHSSELAARLLGQLDAELRNEGVEFAQSLLACEDAPAAAALRSGNYEHAADLLYMAAEADSFPEQALPLPFGLSPASGVDQASLSQLVEATYCGTLDCPRIDGLRATADVLTGYGSVGESGDQLWQIVRAGDANVGCLLIADHPETRQQEIVYVGLIPAVRGRGYGLELTRHAQWLARQAGRDRLVLAVDAANEPAIRIYASAGFREIDRRAIWIKSLRASPNGLPATT